MVKRIKQPSRVASRLLTQPRAKEQKVSPFGPTQCQKSLFTLSRSSLWGHKLPKGDGSLGTPTSLHLPWAFLCGFGLLAHGQEGSITLMPASTPSLHLCLTPTTYVSCKKAGHADFPVPGLCIVTGKDQGIRGCWKLQFR